MLRTNRAIIVGVLLVVPTLLCLMGVGAFLHVVVHAATVEEEHARQQAQRQLEDDQRDAEELSRDIEKLERTIEDIQRRLAEAAQGRDCQDNLAQLQAQQERLQRELAAVLQKLEEWEERLGAGNKDSEELRRQLSEARQKIETLKQQLAEMKPAAEGENAEPPQPGPKLAELRRAIAAAKGAMERQTRKNEQLQAELNGLRQSSRDPNIKIDAIHGSVDWQPPPDPLYVECDGQGIVLQPESVRLRADPSDEEMKRFAQTARRRRYVLFLIRPDGFTAFQQYRVQIGQDKIDFGYEPINQDGRVLY